MGRPTAALTDKIRESLRADPHESISAVAKVCHVCIVYASVLMIPPKRFGLTHNSVNQIRRRLVEEEALAAARAHTPLPAGYQLPSLTPETASIYAALRRGEPIDVVAQVCF